MANDDRRKLLDNALAQIEREYGKGSIMRFGEFNAAQGVETISSGSISLDLALGIGGFPKGRIIEIFGPESSGKTTLALHIMAEAQKAGGVAAMIDAEHAMDPKYAKAIGVNLDELLISQPDTGEQALDICETLEARLMSQAMRKLTAAISKSRTCVVFINQIREKIGVMFGSPETTPGGRALKFYCSVRVDVRRISSIKEGADNTGNRVRARVVKNKLAPPFREAEFDLMFGHGISYEGDLVDLGVEHKVVEKSGAWFSYNGERMGQGRENAKLFLRDHPEVAREIHDRIVAIVNPPEPARDAPAELSAAAAEEPAENGKGRAKAKS
ncbi:MAG: recombinase A [candidate division BRC1 bacterium ADurb.BinA364]|nr:MAG: recombinase A [candidate division BRC1 bacterium ADurb.BinA364]